jgi:hypothetical protein
LIITDPNNFEEIQRFLMKTIRVDLEFDDDDLGPEWMNIENIKLLLYTEIKTKPELLRVAAWNTKIHGMIKGNQNEN